MAKKNDLKSEPFDLDNHWKVNFEYKHVGAHDFPLLSPDGKDLVLTIKRFKKEEVISPNKSKSMCSIIDFEETHVNGHILKPFICNKTNFKNLCTAYDSTRARDFLGKTVMMYVKKNEPTPQGKMDVLRLRSYAPPEEEAKTPIGATEASKAAIYFNKNGHLNGWHEIREISGEQETRIIALAKSLKDENA